MDLAELGIAVKSDPVVDASDRLDKFADSAGRAGDSADEFSDDAKKAGSASEKMSKDLDLASVGFSGIKTAAVAAVAAIATFAAGAASIQSFIEATAEADAQQAQLAAALKSTGGVSGQTVESLNEMAAALQGVTNYGDEAINRAQSLLLTFTKIGSEVFPQATSAILDLSTRMGNDLQGATLQLGKALNDPVLGVSALAEAGIQFTVSQKEMIKSLVEANDIVGAQTIILKELEGQFGGSAKAARETLGGALTSLKNVFGDLFEIGREGSEPLRQAIENLITTVSSPAFLEFAETIGTTVMGAIAVATNGINLLAMALPPLLEGFEVLAPAIAVAFGPTVLTLIGSIATALSSSLLPAITAITAALKANPFGIMVVAVTTAISLIWKFREQLGLTDERLQAIGEVGSRVFNVITAAVSAMYNSVVPWITAIYDRLVMWGSYIYDVLSPAFTALYDTVAPIFQEILGWIDSILTGLENALGITSQVSAATSGSGNSSGGGAAKKMATAIEGAGTTAANKIAKGVEDGGNKASTAITQAGEKTGRGYATALELANANGSKQLADGVDKGGAAAAAAIEASGAIMAAKFEGTGRNIYDLWNNWGNAFIDGFETSIGKLLIDFQRAQTNLINQQAKLAKEQASYYREMTRDLREGGGGSSSSSGSSGGVMGRAGRIGSTSSGGSGNGSVIGGSSGYHGGVINTTTGKLNPETEATERYKSGTMASETGVVDTTRISINPKVSDPSSGKTEQKVEVQVINQVDKNDLLDSMSSKAGKQIIYNVVRQQLPDLIGG